VTQTNTDKDEMEEVVDEGRRRRKRRRKKTDTVRELLSTHSVFHTLSLKGDLLFNINRENESER
jgi:hypothetical protein